MIRLLNHTGETFRGWKRLTTDFQTKDHGPNGRPVTAWSEGPTLLVLGEPNGLDTHALDVWCELAPGASIKIDLSTAKPMHYEPPALTADDILAPGEPMRVNGVDMQFVGPLVSDGAGYSAHLRARVGRMMVVDVHMLIRPDQPWWEGVAHVTASNPSVPDLQEACLGITLTWGTVAIMIRGAGAGTLVPGDVVFADGQGRAFPLTFLALPKMRPHDWAAAGVIIAGGIGAVGIERLLPDGAGQPIYPDGFDPIVWVNSRWARSVEVLHTWEPAVIGPAPVSGVTGAQEDQLFVRGESLVPDGKGVGAEALAYMAALKFANRPCNHREADGGHLRIEEHPNLVFWDGRAHWHAVVSPDQLGKAGLLSPEACSGWYGPDVEHWLIGTLVAGARLSGCPVLQTLMESQALIYLLQWTTKPGISTTQAYASRAVGYECRNAVLLYVNLKNRELAERVKAHWLARWRTVLLPFLQRQEEAFPGGVFMDCRADDPRLGTGWWWIAWQQGLGSYGMHLAGSFFGEPHAVAYGIRAAEQVVKDAWMLDGSWVSQASRPVDSTVIGPEPNGSFNYFGMSLAAAVVERHGSGALKERAENIMTQLRYGATATHQTSWLAP